MGGRGNGVMECWKNGRTESLEIPLLQHFITPYLCSSVMLSIEVFAACADFLCARKSGRFLILILISVAAVLICVHLWFSSSFRLRALAGRFVSRRRRRHPDHCPRGLAPGAR